MSVKTTSPANIQPFVLRRPPSVPAAVSGRRLSVLPGSARASARRLEPHADRLLPARGATAHLLAARRETCKTTCPEETLLLAQRDSVC